MKKKIAVVLFNLGGPSKLDDVFGFLFKLFYDRAILDFPNPLRFCIALLIAVLRNTKAKNIYKKIGNKSPILENTIAQANALEKILNQTHAAKVFISMRYSFPFASHTVQSVKKFKPDQIILLPLYPHYSKTTTGSSLVDWRKNAKHLKIKTTVINDYFDNPGFIYAHQVLLANTIAKHPTSFKKILFSAHSMPQKIIDAGDPYQKQIESTAQLIMQKFNGIDYEVCYQSKVGPTKWLEPSIESSLKKISTQNMGVILVPISFVSEHSETLVELDIYYANLAKEFNLPFYERVPTLGCDENFITCLKTISLSLIE